MLLPSELQCKDVTDLFGQISHTTFLDTPIVILSDTDTIRSSDTFQCILTILVNQTCVIIYDVDATWSLDIYMNQPAHILVHGNLLKFALYRWPFMMSSYRTTLNGRAKVLVICDYLEKVKIWPAVLYHNMFAVEVTVAVLGGGFYTWFPYRSGECGNVSTLVKLEPPQLFPQKIFNDLQGCFISVLALIEIPNVIDDHHGKEIKIIRAIAQKLNLTVQIIFADERSNTNKVSKLITAFTNGILDVYIGSRVLNYFTYAEYETVTVHSFLKAMYLCPAPKPINGMVLLVYAFSLELWVCVALSFLAISRTCYYIKYNNYAMRAWAILLCHSYGNINLDMPNIFTALCYSCCTCLVTSYQARLFLFLHTVPRERPVTTLEELYETDYTFLYYGATEPEHPHIERMKWLQFNPMQEFADGTSYGLVVESEYKYYLQKNRSWFVDDSGNLKHIFLYDSYMRMNCMLLSPGHPLLDVFSDFTLNLVEGGFPDYWEDSGYKSADYKSNTPFSLGKVEGAFFVLILLLSVSIFIFFVEYCNGKKKDKVAERSGTLNVSRNPAQNIFAHLSVL